MQNKNELIGLLVPIILEGTVHYSFNSQSLSLSLSKRGLLPRNQKARSPLSWRLSWFGKLHRAPWLVQTNYTWGSLHNESFHLFLNAFIVSLGSHRHWKPNRHWSDLLQGLNFLWQCWVTATQCHRQQTIASGLVIELSFFLCHIVTNYWEARPNTRIASSQHRGSCLFYISQHFPAIFCWRGYQKCIWCYTSYIGVYVIMKSEFIYPRAKMNTLSFKRFPLCYFLLMI